MKGPFLLLLLLFTVFSCQAESDLQKAKQSVKKHTYESTDWQELRKDLSIEAFENGMSIGSCNYFITLTQTTVGEDSIWVVSDINKGIAKKSGFLFYSSPAELNYRKMKRDMIFA